MPAQEFDFDEGAFIFMFCPFGEATLRTVLRNAVNACHRRNFRIKMVFVNPAYADVLRQNENVKLLSETAPGPNGGYRHSTSVWQVGSD
jgi:hypothetical protein